MAQDEDRDWHYAREGRAVGPASAEELLVLLRAGVVDRGTLTWHAKHSPEWLPLSVHLDLLQRQAASARTRSGPSSGKARPIMLLAAAIVALLVLAIVWIV